MSIQNEIDDEDLMDDGESTTTAATESTDGPDEKDPLRPDRDGDIHMEGNENLQESITILRVRE